MDSLARIEGERLGVRPTYLGNLAAIFSPQRLEPRVQGGLALCGFALRGGPADSAPDGPAAMLPAYNTSTSAPGVAIPRSGARINVDLLNAFQSKGLEEGNPRLLGVGVLPFFLARPLLPRRFQARSEL